MLEVYNERAKQGSIDIESDLNLQSVATVVASKDLCNYVKTKEVGMNFDEAFLKIASAVPNSMVNKATVAIIASATNPIVAGIALIAWCNWHADHSDDSYSYEDYVWESSVMGL